MYKKHVIHRRRKQLDLPCRNAGMQPLDSSTHPSFSNDGTSSRHLKYQQLQDLYVLQLYSKLTKARRTKENSKASHARAAKATHQFVKEHYAKANGTSESERTHMSQSPVRRMHQGPTLNMLSRNGEVLWECETSGPNGNTLFVFEAMLPECNWIIRAMYDSGASGNFVTKSRAS